MTLTFKHDLDNFNVEPACQIKMSIFISFKHYSLDTQTHNGTIALSGPL